MAQHLGVTWLLPADSATEGLDVSPAGTGALEGHRAHHAPGGFSAIRLSQQSTETTPRAGRMGRTHAQADSGRLCGAGTKGRGRSEGAPPINFIYL